MHYLPAQEWHVGLNRTVIAVWERSAWSGAYSSQDSQEEVGQSSMADH